MTQLRIKSLYDAAWAAFRSKYDQAVSDRDHFLTKLQRRPGSDVAQQIQHHVDAALGRIQSDTKPIPAIMKMREFYELRALEMAVQEIQRRIEADTVFYDPDDLLPIVGLSWHGDVLPLLDGNGVMPPENVEKFLGMVRNADQRISFGMEFSARFRQQRQDLVAFLKRAIKMGEAVWCDV
jgi:hypothetical protein